MRTSERLRGLKNWAYLNLCQGRSMKTPAENMDYTQITRTEPKVYLAWSPTRPDSTGMISNEPLTVCPGILIMPTASSAKYVEEKRFDRYNKVRRTQEMGQELGVQMLFSVYEPGIRLPGFAKNPENPSGIDVRKIIEGTEEGLFTLTNWMDDALQLLLAEQYIPDTDLFLKETELTYSLYHDESYVVDKRPIFYGFINAKFACYADDGNNNFTEDLLR